MLIGSFVKDLADMIVDRRWGKSDLGAKTYDAFL